MSAIHFRPPKFRFRPPITIQTQVTVNRGNLLLTRFLCSVQLATVVLPSNARVCAASSSSSDLRKNGPASPNSFMSKRDIVTASLWTRDTRRTDETSSGKKTKGSTVGFSVETIGVHVTFSTSDEEDQLLETSTCPRTVSLCR